MAHGRARDERKERLWRRWIDQWRGSGLSVRAFCARHGLTCPSGQPQNYLSGSFPRG
jgi:hypothetical protein